MILALVACACNSSAPPSHKPRRHGPKINVPDFISHTAAYKGKAIQLLLQIDEDLTRSRERTLREFVGRSVKVRAMGPGQERLHFVITIPPGMPVPEIGVLETANVAFVCTLGSLREGNVARTIERP